MIADFARHLFNSFFAPAEQRYPRSFPRKRHRACASDPAARTGDDPDFSFQTFAHTKSFSLIKVCGESRCSSCLMYVLIEPAHEVLRDVGAVLFRHHLVAISGEPDILQIYVLSSYAGLIEPLGNAMCVWTVIARLPRYIEHGNIFEIDQFVSRCFLQPAAIQVRAVRFLLTHGLQFRRLLDRRVVMEGKIGGAPDVPRTFRIYFRAPYGR